MQVYLDQNRLQKNRSSFRIKLYFWIFLSGLALIGIFYAVFYSPIFKVRNFKITGARHLTDRQVLNILQPLILNNEIKNFSGLNNLFVWNGKNFNVSGTALSKADIDRDWLRQSVIIDIQERERFAIWCSTGDDCHWMDNNGVIFEEAPKTEGSLILTVYDNGEKRISLGDKVIEDRFITDVTAVLKGILGLRLPIQKIIYDGKLQKIQVKTFNF